MFAAGAPHRITLLRRGCSHNDVEDVELGVVVLVCFRLSLI